jgi:hypothetical protein
LDGERLFEQNPAGIHYDTLDNITTQQYLEARDTGAYNEQYSNIASTPSIVRLDHEQSQLSLIASPPFTEGAIATPR